MFLDTLTLKDMSVKDGFIEAQKALSNMGTAYIPGTNKIVKDSDSGMFLSNALERIYPYLHKPYVNFFWEKAMPILYGGGAVEFASFFRVNYNAYDANKNVTSGNNNIITEVHATIQKFQTMVKAYAWSISIGWIDEMKLRQVGSSILQLVDDGVRYYYNQKLDDIAFFGFVNEGAATAYGLANNANVAVTESDVTFATATGEEIVDALNTLLSGIVNATLLDRRYEPNHLLLPPSVFQYLAKPMVVGSVGAGSGTAVVTNVANYFAQNNYIRTLWGNDDLMIIPVPYLETAGTTNSKRAIAYRYDESCIRMPLPMDLTRGATMFDPTAMATKTQFVTFIGSQQFVYIKTIAYLDKI